VDTNGSYQIGGTMMRTPMVDTPTTTVTTAADGGDDVAANTAVDNAREQLHSVF
jgi:hypothetical protein